MTSQLLITFALSLLTYTVNGYSKYGRTCSDIGCMTNEVCVMAEDPCTYRSNECGSYPTCQRKAHAVASCDTFVCPPTTYCRMDGSTPKCIQDHGPLGWKNSYPNANLDPHSVNGDHNNHQPSAPIYPQLPGRGQTTTRAPVYRPNNGYRDGGYQGGAIGSGYPGQPSGGYGGGSIGGGYPGGYSGYQNPGGYPGYHGSSGGGYPGSNTGYYPYNTNPYYSANSNNRYGSNSATTSNPLYDSFKDTLKNIGLLCFLLHAVIARMHQV